MVNLLHADWCYRVCTHRNILKNWNIPAAFALTLSDVQCNVVTSFTNPTAILTLQSPSTAILLQNVISLFYQLGTPIPIYIAPLHFILSFHSSTVQNISLQPHTKTFGATNYLFYFMQQLFDFKVILNSINCYGVLSQRALLIFTALSLIASTKSQGSTISRLNRISHQQFSLIVHLSTSQYSLHRYCITFLQYLQRWQVKPQLLHWLGHGLRNWEHKSVRLIFLWLWQWKTHRPQCH